MSPSSYKTLQNPDETRSLFCQSEGKAQQSSAPIAPRTSLPGGAQQHERHRQQLPPSHHTPHHPRQGQSWKKLELRTGKQAPGFGTDVSIFLTIKPGESGDQGSGEHSTDCICASCAGRTSSPRSCGTQAIPNHPPMLPSPLRGHSPFCGLGPVDGTRRTEKPLTPGLCSSPNPPAASAPQIQLGMGANQWLLAFYFKSLLGANF